MSELPWLNPHSLHFPPVDAALTNPNGLLAVGGDLSSERLVSAYRHGVFPWYEQGQPLLWWSPDPRTILPPSALHVSRSMQKFLRKTSFQVTFDQDFAAVIQHCAEPRGYTDATWITPQMQQAYLELYQRGLAHSVEVWDQGELIGGLYGVALGKVFFGESMFSRRSNASKTGFIKLVQQLESWGFELIDCQMPTDHLESFGASEIPRQEFIVALQELCGNQWGSNWPCVSDHPKD